MEHTSNLDRWARWRDPRLHAAGGQRGSRERAGIGAAVAIDCLLTPTKNIGGLDKRAEPLPSATLSATPSAAFGGGLVPPHQVRQMPRAV